MTHTLSQRHQTFYDLHQSGCFILANPWDAGSAKIFAAQGAKALATSSAAHAFTLGRPDMGQVSRDEALDHASQIVAATHLPVSGDLENGYGDQPEDVSQTVKLAQEAGLSGCSIEDTQMTSGTPAYEFELAVERIRAGAATARAQKHPFIFCARADGVMNGSYDFQEALLRAKAFEKAGADLIYVPLPGEIEQVSQLIASITKPINVLAAGPLARYTFSDLAKIGVRRVSLGSQPARVTHGIINKVAQNILQEGSFTSFDQAASGSEIDELLSETPHGS